MNQTSFGGSPTPATWSDLEDGLMIGQGVIFVIDVDIFPHCHLPAGTTGTIVAFGDQIGVLLDCSVYRQRLDVWNGVFWLDDYIERCGGYLTAPVPIKVLE